VAQDYVAGTHPADTNDVFRATITIGEGGVPTIGWTPAECPYGPRRYTLLGAPSLDAPAAWAATDATSPAADFYATNRFFRVSVELP
jgi:hypothetical protein